MKTAPMTILYVADTEASLRFYTQTLDAPVLHAEPGFAMLALGEGARLGLWCRDSVQPPLTGETPPGASELAVTLPDRARLTALHDRLAAQGVRVLQPCTVMDFGEAFTVADPDGHRLRVYVPRGV